MCITSIGKQGKSAYILLIDFSGKTALGYVMENRITNKCGFLSDGYVMEHRITSKDGFFALGMMR